MRESDDPVVQLLHKEKVKTTEHDATLMKVLHQSVASVLPPDSRRFGSDLRVL